MVARAIGSAIELSVVSTNHRGHARQLAADSHNYDLVIGFGGDGTVNEVVNGLIDPETGRSRGPRLGVIPGGNVNVFARAAGISPDPTEATEQLIESIASARTRALNLGCLNWHENDKNQNRVFNFSAGIGLDATVIHEVDRLRRIGNPPSRSMYFVAAAKTILATSRSRNPKPLALVTGERQRTDLAVALVTTTDPWTYIKDRPIRPTPGASFDGGIDMMAVTSGSAAAVFRAAQVLVSGKTPRGQTILHLHDQETIVLESVEVLPLQADGEAIGFAKRLQITSLPRALEIHY